MAVKHRVSVGEYLATPEEKPYLEYADGILVPKMAPDFRHTGLAGELVYRFRDYSRRHGGFAGPEPRVEFQAADGGTYFRLPDVAWWAPGLAVEGPRAMVPPTIAVEIRSSGQSLDELRQRCRFYVANGVDAAWLVDPDTRTVECLEADADAPVAYRDGGTLEPRQLPGFALPVADLFAAIDR